MTLAPLANAVEAYRYQQILTNMKQATSGGAAAEAEEEETANPINKCRVRKRQITNLF